MAWGVQFSSQIIDLLSVELLLDVVGQTRAALGTHGVTEVRGQCFENLEGGRASVEHDHAETRRIKLVKVADEAIDSPKMSPLKCCCNHWSTVGNF